MEFIEIPTWNLNDYVIDRGLKEGARGLCNRVSSAHLDNNLSPVLRRFSQWDNPLPLEAKCRTPAHTWVDLNGNDFFVFGIYRKLHITSSCKIPHGAHHFETPYRACAGRWYRLESLQVQP